MNQSLSLTEARIAILGLGLMGGSLALALKGQCKEILGIDPQVETIELALRIGAVNRASTQPEMLLPEANVVVLAAPVGTILDLIMQLPDLHSGNAMLMDIGSTKVNICDAMNRLPARFDPIGGHPMCGKETSGLENAEAALFTGAPFALLPLHRTSDSTKLMAEQIVKAINAHPLWLEPEVHDRWTASTSHMPYLLSIALALATPEDATSLIGPGFRSTSRLACSSTEMMLEILMSNRENVQKALEDFRDQLDQIETAIQNEDTLSLSELLSRGKVAYHRLLQNSSNEEGL